MHRLIDDLERLALDGDGTVDLVPSFAAPLPIEVITDLLGVPDAHAEEFARYGTCIGGALDGITSLRHAGELKGQRASSSALRRPVRAAPPRAGRRHGEHVGRRRGRPDRRRGDAPAVRPAAGRRLRDHRQPDRQRGACPARAPGSVGGSVRATRATGGGRGRGDAAVRPACPAHRRVALRRHGDRRAAASARTSSW